jgi:hypothetical protein
MSNLFGDFDYKMPDDNSQPESKGFDLMSYADYIAETEEKKKKKVKKPKEQKNDLLKIVMFETNKSKIKLRHLQEKKIIPAHPFRLLLVGRSGSGKSMNLVNLMTRPHMYGRLNQNNPKSHYFDIIFLFSPTAEGGDDLADHLELTDNRIVTNEAQFVPVLQHILQTQKDLIAKNGLLKSPKICLIFDDCQSAEKFLKSPDFTKIFIAGRHYNISVICCGQSWTKFHRVTRLNASNIMLYPSSGSEVDLLCDEYCPPNKTKKQFRELIGHATDKPYQFLHINNQVPIAERYRKNLDVMLTINE